MWVVLLRLYVEDIILLGRQGQKLCIKYIYLIFADVTFEPRGQVRIKKSNQSRDTADLQLRNNARSQCVVTGRWKYTYIGKKKKKKRSFQMQQNKKAEIFQLSELVTVNSTGETADIKRRIQFSGSGSNVSHVGWGLIQMSLVFIRLEKDTKFSESYFLEDFCIWACR